MNVRVFECGFGTLCFGRELLPESEWRRQADDSVLFAYYASELERICLSWDEARGEGRAELWDGHRWVLMKRRARTDAPEGFAESVQRLCDELEGALNSA